MDKLEQALANAIYPQLRGTRDSQLRAEVVRRTRRARAVLLDAGYEIVPRQPAALSEAERNVTGEGEMSEIDLERAERVELPLAAWKADTSPR